MKLKKLWNFVYNYSIREDDKESDKEYIHLFNQFRIILFFLFLIHSINNYFFLKDNVATCALSIITLCCALSFLIPNIIRSNAFLLAIFMILIGIVFFFESYSGFTSGISLYYLPILLGAPFVFWPNKETKYISAVLGFMIISILINVVTSYSLFTNLKLTEIDKENTFIISLITSFMIILLDIVFIMRKNKIINTVYARTNNNSVEIDQIEKVVDLVKHNYSSFFTAFTEIYPNFSDCLFALSSQLTINDVEICALMKLGFSTKEIAQYTRLSIRAIEGRKYRIRKKLDISTEKELLVALMNYPCK